MLPIHLNLNFENIVDQMLATLTSLPFRERVSACPNPSRYVLINHDLLLHRIWHETLSTRSSRSRLQV